MSTRPLAEELAAHHNWLFDELGFRQEDAKFDAESFGDSYVVLDSPAFRLRFLRDRGQIFCEVASPQDRDNWLDLRRVLQYTLGNADQNQFELRALSDTVNRNFATLKLHLGAKYPELKSQMTR